MKQRYTIGDCYKILLINPDCSWEELRKAYRLQVKKWHPDRFPSGSQEKLLAEDKIKYITAAYKQISVHYREYGRLPEIEENPEQQEVSQPTYAYNARTATVSEQPSQPAVNNNTEYTRTDSKKFFRYIIALSILSFLLYAGYTQNPAQKHHQATEDTIKKSKPDNTDSHLQKHPLDTAQTFPAQNNLPFLDNTPEARTRIGFSAKTDNNKTHAEEKAETRDFFTLGSSIGEVIDVQGEPNRIEGDTWYYGESEVYFYEGSVINWKRKHGSPLKARIIVKKSGTDKLDSNAN